jgi:hypothetical protein
VSATASSIFISYRREESAGHAGRLYDVIAGRFGADDVFLDVELPPGCDFVERITAEVGACRALIVVIGPRWAEPTEGRPTARIADPEDFVRLEVEIALRSPQVAVFPVLVGGARMPAPAQLPESLRPLAHHNALELSDLRWAYDSGRLIDALERLEGDGRSRPSQPEDPVEDETSGGQDVTKLLPVLAEGIVVAAAAGMLGRALAGWVDDHTTTGVIAATILRRAVTWSIVAAVLGAWLTLRRGERRQLAGRALAGLVLGALAGGLGGALYELPRIVNAGVNLSPTDLDRLALGSLLVTGAVLGAAIGVLWIPPRKAAGLFGGALGGALVQLAMNGWGTPADVLAVGIQCVLIVGLALAAMLALDVRAASLVAPELLATPQPAAHR